MKDIYRKAEDSKANWGRLSVKERLHYILSIKLIMTQDMDIWLTLLCEKGSKTPTDALTSDMMTTLSFIKFLEKKAVTLLKPRKERTPIYAFSETAVVYQVPYGVTLIFSPWNFPVQLSLIPVLTALITGNVVILKPSEYITKDLIQRMRNLFHQAQFPEGVVQIIEGGPETGQALIKQKPDKLFFTGGTQTGKTIYQAAAMDLIPCELELGGKDALVVLEDAHVERAARAAVWGSFFNLGQVCIGIERVFIHESVKIRFVKEVLSLTEELVQGRDLPTQLNDLVKKRVLEQLADARQKGARLLSGHWDLDGNKPIVLAEVNLNMLLMREETFGPILPIMTFQTDDEAIQLVNQSSFGLNASVFSKNLSRAETLALKLEVGSCSINNVVTNISYMNLPFGGRKGSGFGISHGREGLYAFTRPCSVTRQTGKRQREVNWFPYGERNLGFLKKMVRVLFR